MTRAKHVAVLMGGFSAEREVSLVSGAAVVKALKEVGYLVTAIDVQRDVGTLLTRLYPRPDAVFNALHGRYGEDGSLQGLLDILAVPYTHSGLCASALAMNKPVAQRLFQAAGLKIADHVEITRAQLAQGDPLPRPYVIKPLNDGSSVGVQIIKDGDQPVAENTTDWPYGETIMAETYIPGREFTVAVMGDRPLAVTEILTENAFYDYDAKYTEGQSTHVIPADIPPNVYEETMSNALLAHQTLGCHGVSRADFRYDGKDLFILEVNTQPGMTPTSLVPEQAAHLGISFPDLCRWMVERAKCDP